MPQRFSIVAENGKFLRFCDQTLLDAHSLQELRKPGSPDAFLGLAEQLAGFQNADGAAVVTAPYRRCKNPGHCSNTAQEDLPERLRETFAALARSFSAAKACAAKLGNSALAGALERSKCLLASAARQLQGAKAQQIPDNALTEGNLYALFAPSLAGYVRLRAPHRRELALASADFFASREEALAGAKKLPYECAAVALRVQASCIPDHCPGSGGLLSELECAELSRNKFGRQQAAVRSNCRRLQIPRPRKAPL